MSISKIVSLLLGILLSLSVFAQPKQQSRIAELIPKQADNGKYGYVDSLDQWVIEAQFDTVSIFSYGGLAFAHDRSGWLLLDRLGEVLADRIHPDLELTEVDLFPVQSVDSSLDQRWISSVKCIGDSLVVFHKKEGVLGRFPNLSSPEFERTRRMSSIMRRSNLALHGSMQGWKAIVVGDVQILLDENWQEVGHWAGVNIHLSPTLASVSFGDSLSQLYELGSNDSPVVFDHEVYPFSNREDLLLHSYFEEDTSSNQQLLTRNQLSLSVYNSGVRPPRKIANFLLNVKGDTVLSGKEEFSFSMETRDFSKWGLPRLQFACAGVDYSECEILDKSLSFMQGAAPVYSNSEANVWINQDGELRLRRLSDGEILSRTVVPDLFHTNRNSDVPSPFIISGDSVYRLDFGNKPVTVSSVLATPQKILEQYGRWSTAQEVANKYTLETFEKYNSAGLDVRSQVFQNDSGMPYTFDQKVDGNRFILKPDGGNSGVYDSLGNEIIPPVYSNIYHESIQKIEDGVFSQISFFRLALEQTGEYGLSTYDGRELFSPKSGLRSYTPKGELTPFRLAGGGTILLDSFATVRSDTFERYEFDRHAISGKEVHLLYDQSPVDRRQRIRTIFFNDNWEQLSQDIKDEDIFCQKHRSARHEFDLVKATRSPLGKVGVRSLDGTWLIEPRYDTLPIVMNQYAVGRIGDSIYVESFKDGITAVLPLSNLRPTSADHVIVHLVDPTKQGPVLSSCSPGFEGGPAQGPLYIFTTIGPDGNLLVPLSGEYRPIVYVGGLSKFFQKNQGTSLFFNMGKSVDSLTFNAISIKANNKDKLESEEVMYSQLPENLHSRIRIIVDSLENPKAPSRIRATTESGVPWLLFRYSSDTTWVFNDEGKYLTTLSNYIPRQNFADNTQGCKILAFSNTGAALFSVTGDLLQEFQYKRMENHVPTMLPNRGGVNTRGTIRVQGPVVLPDNWRYLHGEKGGEIVWLCGTK